MDCSPQAPLSMGFSKQAYWSGLPFPSLGDLPNQEIKPESSALPTVSIKILGSYIYVNQQTDFKVYIERQKTWKSQHNIEGEERMYGKTNTIL